MAYRGVKHKSVIGIDPGEDTGWTLYVDGLLWYSTVVAFDTLIKSPPEAPPNLGPVIVVIENPVIYPERGGADPKDLLKLARKVGRLELWYQLMRPTYKVRLVEPRQWKGTLNKKIHHKHVLSRLTTEERSILPVNRAGNYDHNMLDSVGLGYYQLEVEDQR